MPTSGIGSRAHRCPWLEVAHDGDTAFAAQPPAERTLREFEGVGRARFAHSGLHHI
jgi:hypothetical protein